MLDEYFSFTHDIMKEGRRAFCLDRAVQASHDRMTAEDILAMAKVWESWLAEAEVKSEHPKKPSLKVAKAD